MLVECKRKDRKWSLGINDHSQIRKGDMKRLFSPMNDCNEMCAYNPTAVLKELGFGKLLDETEDAKGTGILQIDGCNAQIEHSDYRAGTAAMEGVSVPFGALLALTPRSTYVLPKSHKLQGQARIIVHQEPGDLLLMRGDVRQ